MLPITPRASVRGTSHPARLNAVSASVCSALLLGLSGASVLAQGDLPRPALESPSEVAQSAISALANIAANAGNNEALVQAAIAAIANIALQSINTPPLYHQPPLLASARPLPVIPAARVEVTEPAAERAMPAATSAPAQLEDSAAVQSAEVVPAEESQVEAVQVDMIQVEAAQAEAAPAEGGTEVTVAEGGVPQAAAPEALVLEETVPEEHVSEAVASEGAVAEGGAAEADASEAVVSEAAAVQTSIAPATPEATTELGRTLVARKEDTEVVVPLLMQVAALVNDAPEMNPLDQLEQEAVKEAEVEAEAEAQVKAEVVDVAEAAAGVIETAPAHPV